MEMASSSIAGKSNNNNNNKDAKPHITLSSQPPSAQQNVEQNPLQAAPSPVQDGSRVHRRLHRQPHHQKHIQLPPLPKSSASSIYMGSYSHTSRHSRTELGSIKTGSSVRNSLSDGRLEDLLQDLDLDLETYGVEEQRDGFFDAAFFKPAKTNHEDLMREAKFALPASFRKRHPLSPKHFLPRQWDGLKKVCGKVLTSRAGIKLSKSFLAFFIAYILCLVPVVGHWLGRYNYIIVISAILNHPGRTIGAEIDGVISTILGTAAGLGWGTFALWVSDSTAAARHGYGGVLAAFLISFMGIIAALRSYYIRVYQFVLCAGIAMIYTTLADTSEVIDWKKLFDYGVPWVLGQALCLLICCTVFPDAGARSLALSLHSAFNTMEEGLTLPHSEPVDLHRKLAYTFVQTSQAHRDLVIDLSLTRFKPKDIEALRNLIQAVIRSLLSLKMESHHFDKLGADSNGVITRPSSRFTPEIGFDGVQSERHQSLFDRDPERTGSSQNDMRETVIDIDGARFPALKKTTSETRAVQMIIDKLSKPTADLILCMKSGIRRSDAVLMDMSGYRKYLGPPESVSSDILAALTKIRKTMIKYDEEENSLMDNPELPPTYSDHPEVVELFLFVHPIRQAASSVESLLVKVMEMQQRHPGWRIYLPSYPLRKALQRTNAQVRHDRGGVTAGFFFRSQAQLAHTMRGMANIYKPLPRQPEHVHGRDADGEPKAGITRAETLGKYEEEAELATSRNMQTSREKRLRYRIWMNLHKLQGFETRFALKVVIATSLLSVPAWLSQSREWFNNNETWWAVVSVWIMMHPRTGGNLQDLVTRAFCAILGAIWGGLAYGAGNGNPYVMAVFAAIYMIPMIYRFTQSSHPRSGIMGCVSYTVVSLSAKAADGLPSAVEIAWTRGTAFVVGVIAAVMVNWILWPFVARHELRKALSGMLIYCSIIYRGVVAQYVYYEEGSEPGKDNIERSEMLEGRLREGFVRIRQLMALTRHEIRLRGPFDPLPYSGLIDACERFFEYLVAVRQSSLFFHPHFLSDNKQAADSMLAYRRDAVAAILMNLYVLAGALRGNRKVPRYLPSAAVARKRLLDHMALVEAAHLQPPEPHPNHSSHPNATPLSEEQQEERRWAQIYSYSYSQSLTGCVKQLEQLQKYTKEIVGEQGFDPVDDLDYTGEDEDSTPTYRTTNDMHS